jgi:hypothetical protein
VLSYDAINAKIGEKLSEIEFLKSIQTTQIQATTATCTHVWHISHIDGPRDNNEYDYICSKCGCVG